MNKNTSPNKLYHFLIFGFLLIVNFESFAQVGIATTTPLSTFEVNGSIGQTITTVVADLTLDASHSVLVCKNGAVARTITLPSASGIKGRVYCIKRDDTSTANITIATSPSQKIDGELNLILTRAKQFITLISDGTDWKIIGTSETQNPVGELSYFSTTGTLITLNAATTDGSSNLFFCNPVTSLSSDSVNFLSTQNGRLQYVGTTKQSFRIVATVSATTSSNGTYIYGFRKSNTNYLSASRVLEKLNISDDKTTSIQALVSLEPNDFIELWVGKIGETGNVTIKSLNLFASGL